MKTMVIKGETLRNVLGNIRARNPYISGYRKWPDGKVRRYIDWNRETRRAAR